MLAVRTYLAPSKHHGIGLFAAEFIRKDQIIDQFVAGQDWAIADADLASLAEVTRQFVRHFGYLTDTRTWIVGLDNARFMNHGEQPNCREELLYTRALRDIHPQEELTTDYLSFDRDASRKLGR